MRAALAAALLVLAACDGGPEPPPAPAEAPASPEAERAAPGPDNCAFDPYALDFDAPEGMEVTQKSWTEDPALGLGVKTFEGRLGDVGVFIIARICDRYTLGVDLKGRDLETLLTTLDTIHAALQPAADPPPLTEAQVQTLRDSGEVYTGEEGDAVLRGLFLTEDETGLSLEEAYRFEG